jgi:P-loop containing dynein motor region
VVACGPPGGGRNQVTARFYRHFNIINYVELSDESLCLIFTTILSNFLSNFDASVLRQATGLVKATVAVYNTILEDLRPTPAKPHYTFNMRDISKVCFVCVVPRLNIICSLTRLCVSSPLLLSSLPSSLSLLSSVSPLLPSSPSPHLFLFCLLPPLYTSCLLSPGVPRLIDG